MRADGMFAVTVLCSNVVYRKGASRPSWALLAVVSEGEETALFKEKFLGWTFSKGDDAQDDVSASTPVILTVQWLRIS